LARSSAFSSSMNGRYGADVAIVALRSRTSWTNTASYEKGHRHLTVVRDLDIGRVIWVCQTWRNETLDAFFTELGEVKCARIEICVIDMWDPYIASIHEHTHVEIVYDLFHVAQKITDAVDTIRKHEFDKADATTRKKFKKKRFSDLEAGKAAGWRVAGDVNLVDDGEQAVIPGLSAERAGARHLRRERHSIIRPTSSNAERMDSTISIISC
jgi:hypothetical protein